MRAGARRGPGRGGLSAWLLLVPGAGFIFFFVASAVGVTVLQSFGLLSLGGPSRFTLSYWAILGSREVQDSLLFSLKMGVGSSIGTVALALPLALLLRKSDPVKSVLGSLIKVPLFIPALVAAFLIVNLISYHGLVNQLLMFLGLIREPLRMLNDRPGWGVITIQVWKNLPFVLLILSASLASIRDDVIDAARNLGAGRIALLRDIYVPLAMPGILVAMILMFIKAFGDFPITSVAGPTYPNSLAVRMLITATMFQEWGQAAVQGVLIIVTALIVVAVYSRLAGLLAKE
jgi:putative spermidine/putrescine transport system permease protein